MGKVIRCSSPLAVAVRRSSITPGLYHIRPGLSRGNFRWFRIDHRLKRCTQPGRRGRCLIARGLYHMGREKSRGNFHFFRNFLFKHLFDISAWGRRWTDGRGRIICKHLFASSFHTSGHTARWFWYLGTAHRQKPI